MAHLPSDYLPGADPFNQPKTLFLIAPGREGILLIRTGAKFRSRRKRFSDPHAALDWCIANRAGMVFYQAADPKRN
jgi:hypothetical protein